MRNSGQTQTHFRSSGKKAKGVRDLARLEEIPNIGPSIGANLRQLGITVPSDLPGRDPYAMYEDLCAKTGQRHDPCLLDTFIAAVRFMEGSAEKAVVEVHGGTKARNGGTSVTETRFGYTTT